MDELTKKFQECAATTKAFVEKYEEVKAEGMCADDKMSSLMSYVQDLNYAFRSLSYQIDYLFESLSAHRQGHLPPIKSTEQMERAIKSLGLDKEYDVEKRTIYASRGAQFVIG